MAIVSFWSNNKKETGQTLSIVAMATYMSVEHNYKTLVIDATVDDDTIERCFWNKNINKDLKDTLNRGKIDIVSGTEGLISALSSNKTTPEIISNYTKVVYKNRLDILLGMKTQSVSIHEKNLDLYTELLSAANKFYDLVIIDLPKGLERNSVDKILKMSDVIMYTMSQNLKQIEKYIYDKLNLPLLKNHKVIPILGSANEFCKYNPKNVMIKIRDKNLAYINYNSSFLEAASEAKVSEFFLRSRLNKAVWDKNANFLNSVAQASQIVIEKFEEIKYGKVLK